jgi:hypothetical protein
MKDIPIPSFAFPNRHDGSVYVVTIDKDGKKHRKTIGALTHSEPGEERMVPNQYFKDVYQDLWNEAYPNKKIPSHEMSIGIYALTLAICSKSGIYSALQDVYGPMHANSMLDYAMFSILHRSDVTQLYETTMQSEVLFSDKLYSDSWYSKLFSKKLSEDQHHLFRIKRIEELVKTGLKKVWIGIDGSNNDCEARNSFLAKFGFPKSHNTNKTIVGYMYAVDAQTGRPVTYFTYEGSVPDNQAFQKMATFLDGFDIEIEGVILDRGFAVEEVFRTIERNNWKYVIMLPTNTDGHTKMTEQYSEIIRWKSQFILDDEVLFGISDAKKLFARHDRVSSICLYFDGSNGSIQSVRLSKQILAAKKKIKKAIASGSRASVAKPLRKYLSIEGEGPDRIIIEHFDEWDKCMAGKGFFSLAVSEGINPSQANRLYKMRDTSETQFSILKTQEGGHATHVHKTEGIYSKFAVLFIASIIRFEIEESCKKLGFDTNPFIQSLDRIALLYTAADKYEAVRNLTTEQKELFKLFNVEQDDFEYLSRDFNSRNKTLAKDPERKLPDKETPLIVINSHKKGRPPKQQSTNDEKTNSTVESEVIKSKGGRPKGKKDSKPRKPRSDKGKIRGPRTRN